MIRLVLTLALGAFLSLLPASLAMLLLPPAVAVVVSATAGVAMGILTCALMDVDPRAPLLGRALARAARARDRELNNRATVYVQHGLHPTVACERAAEDMHTAAWQRIREEAAASPEA